MNLLTAKALVKAKLPFIYLLYQSGREHFVPAIFRRIYRENHWGDPWSVSGPGSSLAATEYIRKEISQLIHDLELRTILDIPCGDHLWINYVTLGACKYIGADIVEELVKRNSQRYASKDKQFLVLDITKAPLPRADLVLCRDCLVHLSFKAISRALRNIKSSGSKYILTTTFTNRATNDDTRTGGWRVLNLNAEPFNFPQPILVINENCKEGGGVWRDKSLGLWLVDSMPTMKVSDDGPCGPHRRR